MDEVSLRLRQLVARSMGWTELPDTMPDEMPLAPAGLGLDSIAVLQLLVAIEQDFGLVLDEHALTPAHVATLRALDAFVREQIARQGRA